MTNKLKFFVAFDYELPNGKERRYKKSIILDCTPLQFDSWLEKNQDSISALECTYGVLDISGRNKSIGFVSYEIEQKDCNIVWLQLLELLQKDNLL